MNGAAGAPVVVARAPGRVNLIGDHTDYNGGVALPMAIDLATEAVYARAPGAPRLHLVSDQEPEPVDIELTGPGATGAGDAPLPRWGRLAAAVVAAVGPGAGGEVRLSSTVPLGAGLSSSASFAVALALALGADDDAHSLARLCRDAEGRAGAQVGLMDPLVIAAAHEGRALLLDFAEADPTDVVVPPDAEVVVVHSGQRRHLADSPYAERRAQCEEAARFVGPLGRADPAEAAALADPVLRRRARHVVSECARVHRVVDAFGRGDLVAAGALLSESHRSLASDFEVSTPSIDALVARLAAVPGVFGARLTGGGFGGCVVALARPGALDPASFAHGAWRVRPGPGARRHPPDLPA